MKLGNSKTPKSYGKALKRLSMTKEEKEKELEDNPLIDEEMAVSIFK